MTRWDVISTTIVNPKSFDSRYAHGGIAQVLFFESAETCGVSDADRKGKHQGQQGIVPPTV